MILCYTLLYNNMLNILHNYYKNIHLFYISFVVWQSQYLYKILDILGIYISKNKYQFSRNSNSQT